MSWEHNISWIFRNKGVWALAFWLAWAPGLMAWAPGLMARDSGVEVRSSSAKVLETAPGKVITASFLVANRDPLDGEFVETLTLPPGWLKIAPAEDRFSVAARAEELRLLAILVPASAASGATEIRYAVRGARDHALTDAASFTVRVLAVSRLEILVEDKPEVVIAGEDYEVKVRVINHGNSTNRIRWVITSTAMPQAAVRPEPSELVLPPASGQTVRFRAPTEATLKNKITQVLSFKAVGEDGTGASTTSPAQAATVEVIPRVTGDTDNWNRLPAQLRIVGAKDTGRGAGMQMEFSGAGNLDETGQRKTEFLFRGPDLQQQSMYGQRDEYRVGYYDPRLDILVGDRSYTLSPLIERYAYGRGAELDLHTTNHTDTAKILYLESRPPQPHFSEIGGSLEHAFTPWLSLQGNYLNREGSGHAYWTNGLAQSLYSLEPKLRLGKALDLDLEFAASDGRAQRRASDQAVRLDLRGELFEDVHYALEKAYAGPGFYGGYNDVDSLQSALVFPIYRKLRGSLAFTDYSNNLENDPAKGATATRETTYRPGIRYTLPFRTELQVDYQHIVRADVLLPAAYDFTEDSVRLGLGRTFGQISLQTFIEQGQLQDRVLDRTSDSLHRYSVYASYRPTARQTYSAYTRIGNSSFTSNPEQSQSYGAAANWQLSDHFSLNVNYEQNTYDSTSGRQQDSARTALSYKFPNQHNVALEARWSRSSPAGADETAVLVAYTIPFRLPISKKSSVGTLKGRVFDQESSLRTPLPRVILMLDDAWAVTDRQGEFEFPSLKPGKYWLRVDSASLGANRVTALALPAMVEIKKGTPGTLDLGVVTAASVIVRVAVASLASTNAATRATATVSPSTATTPSTGLLSPASPVNAPCEGIVVELSNGKVKLQAYTATDGRAIFDHLRPGEWVCKVRDNNLPAYHYVENPEIKMDLVPGEKRAVAVRVLARQRTIQFIDSGEVK